MNTNHTDLPQSLFEFNSVPVYFYTNVRWKIIDDPDSVIVTSKRRKLTWIIVPFIVIEAIILLTGYYIGTLPNNKIDCWNLTLNYDTKIVQSGIYITGIVLFLVSFFMYAFYKYDFYVWQNPRMTINIPKGDVTFQNGNIKYSNVALRDIRLLRISGYVHTPNLKHKSHFREQLYACIQDTSGFWCRHIIAVVGVIESTSSRKRFDDNVAQLQRMIKCDVVQVKYPHDSNHERQIDVVM